MEAFIYLASPAKVRSKSIRYIALLLVFLVIPPLAHLVIYYVGGFDTLAGYWAQERERIVFMGGMLCISALIWLSVAVMLLHSGLISRIFLRLDSDGLTCSTRFRRRRWLWRDVSAFAFEAAQMPSNIAFYLPGQKPGSLRRGSIEDQYDVPLEEIAAKLNEYRERAIRSDRSSTVRTC